MRTILFAGVIVLLLSIPATAWWPDDPWVNVPICTESGNQSSPQLVSDGAGGAVITWADFRSGSDDDLYAQRIGSDGLVRWATNGEPVCVTSGAQALPQLVSDGSGGAIITWQDDRGGDSDIYAQRIDSDGIIQWITNGKQICSISEEQIHPQLISDGSGGAIITWTDLRSGSDNDIYAQRIGSDGIIQWITNGKQICSISEEQIRPQLISDGSGGAIITWMDFRDGYDIYAQRIDSDGIIQWVTDGVPVCITTMGQGPPQLISDGSGGAIITWEDYRNVSDSDIYAQRVNSNGDAQWLTDGVPVCTTSAWQNSPQLVSDGSGGAIIAWQDSCSGSDYNIYAQRIGSDGVVRWATEGAPICTTSGTQWIPQLVSDGSGGAVITWPDGRWGVFDYDVYAQRVNGDGNPLWRMNGRPVSEPFWDQVYPQLAADGFGGAIVAWDDGRNGELDIYAQRVNHNGTLGPVPYILSIVDVPSDQGRQVSIMWERSFLDDAAYDMITEYSIWRKYPQGSKIEGVGQEFVGRLPEKIVPGIYRRIERRSKGQEAKIDYWELLGTVEAHFWEGYAYIAATLDDSSAGGVPYFTYVVSAHTEDPLIFWDSRADSGYSVDNINPAKTQLTAAPLAEGKSPVSTIWLTWEEVIKGVNGRPEPDPVSYRVYCDTDPEFDAGPGHLLAEISELNYSHTDGRIGDPAVNLYYAVTAVDAGGNESAASNRVGEFDRHLDGAK
jgi:hypothetical protein